MLDRRHRLTRSADFTRTTRSGRRAGTRTLVLHAHAADHEGASDAVRTDPRVGFVVGRAVGTAVVRTKVKRRLRHLVRERLAAGTALPPGLLVVRALPSSATATYDRLGADLDAGLARLATRRSR